MFSTGFKKVRLLVVLSAMLVMSISAAVLATDAVNPVQDNSSGAAPAVFLQTTPAGANFLADSVSVASVSEFNAALNGTASAIQMAPGTYAFDSQIRITRAVNIVGAGDSTVITKGAGAWTNPSGEKGHAPLITIYSGANAVKLESIKVTGARNIPMAGNKTDYGSGINVVSSSNVTLKNVSLTDNSAAGLIVNSSAVTAENLNTSGNGWYGVNVDKADSGPASFTLAGGVLGEAFQIYSDKGADITVSAAGYAPYSIDNTVKTIWTDRPHGATITRNGNPLTNRGVYTILYSTIQAAINSAAVGDTINVPRGTYREDVNVNKKVTLIGTDGAANTVIIATTGNTNPLAFGANDATVNGFTLTHEYTAAEINAWTFNNNGVIFLQNTSGNTLTNCIVTLNRNGVYLNTCQNNNIVYNTISNNRTGINMTGNINGTTITGNTICENWTLGLVYYQQSGFSNLSTITLSGNTFDRNWYSEILIKDSPNSTGTLDATNNTFTDTPVTYTTSADTSLNEPGFTSQIPNVTGISSGTAIKPVKDLPTLRIYNSGPVILKYADANKFKTLNVGAAEPYKTIQSAIDSASAGDTVNVAAGTYVEDVNVNKKVTLVGAEGAGNTKIVATTGNTNPLTFSTNDATVNGFTLTHNYTAAEITAWSFNNNGVAFMQNTSGNTLTNCIVSLNRNGVYLNTCQNNNIVNNTITNNRTGINLTGNINGTAVTGNTISGNWTLGLVYYQQSGISNLSTLTVTGNTFDSNWYTEVLIKDSPNSTGTLDVTNNTFTDVPVTYTTSADASLNEPGFTSQIPNVAGISGGTAVKPVKDLPTLRIYNSGPVVLKYEDGINKHRTLNVGAAEPYKTLQPAIDAASAGDIINVSAGIYSADQFLVLAGKGGITIAGAGIDQTFFNLTAVSDGFKVQADNVTLEDFTIDGTNTANYGLRAQGVDDLTVQNVKITKMKKSAFDVNGVTNSSFSGLIAANNGGYGIAINQSKNVVFAGNTSSNTWGAINVVNKPQPYTNKETSGIDITNVVSAESSKLSLEDYNPDNAAAEVLSGLSISSGTLDQTFSTSLLNYTASVPNSVSDLTLTAAVTSNTYKDMSVKASLAVGQNIFPIRVYKADGSLAKIYTLTVTRNQVITPPPVPTTDPGDTTGTSGGSSNTGGGQTGGSSGDNQAVDEIKDIINTEFLAGQSEKDTVAAIDSAIDNIEKITDPKTAANQAVLIIQSTDNAIGASVPSAAVQEQIQTLVDTVMDKVSSQTVSSEITGTELKAVVSQNNLKDLENKMAEIVSTANQISSELGKTSIDATVEKVLNLDVVTTSSALKSTVDFPSSILTSAQAAGIDKVSINTGVANIAIQPGSFTGTGTVELSARKLNTAELPDTVKAQVQNNPVYDFTMLVGTNKVSSFNKEVEVSIPYNPAQGENPDSITVYYISDNGELVNVSGVYDAATKTVRFSTNHFSIYMVKQNPVSFKDLVKFEWAKKSVEFLAAKGIIKGYSIDIFKPGDKITKSQMISLVTRALKLSANSTAKSFNDLKKGSWYYNDMVTAVNLGLISGDKNGNIQPEKDITRQEMAVIVGKLLVNGKHKAMVTDADADAILGGFVDKKLISPDAKKYTAISVKYGILEGVSDSLFAPAETMTRAQAAAVTYRLFNMD